MFESKWSEKSTEIKIKNVLNKDYEKDPGKVKEAENNQ